MKVDVMVCVRCGGRHMGMEFAPLPMGGTTVQSNTKTRIKNWWGMCPKTQSPIILEEQL
jgi:hypothetical protein